MLLFYRISIFSYHATHSSGSSAKRLDLAHGVGERDGLLAMVAVEQDVAVAAHAELLHVAELAQAVARLHALDEVMTVVLRQRVDEVDGSLVDGEDIG